MPPGLVVAPLTGSAELVALAAAEPGTLRRIGGYHFVEAHVVENRHADGVGA